MITPERLAILRKKHGYSQGFVAQQLSMSRPTYIAIERGERSVTLPEAEILAKLLDLSFEEFATGKLIAKPEVVIEKTKKQKARNDKPEMRISIPQEKVEKFKQVLLYVLQKVGGKPNIGQTVLYKLLYFIDFDYYEKFEEQLMGAKYMRNTHGPTPVLFGKIVEELKKKGAIEAIKSKFYKYDQTKYLINPEWKSDLSALSAQELAHIDWELDRLSDYTATKISDLSHKDTPWLVAKEKEILDYEFVFYRPEETSVREYEPL